ncbi:biotin--[acetyl-CoA-carboxylase] ligase [Microbacteriaceae bacterium VKM Ac-2854]|nr:biotin--[acetyl-CoA-carboxylase] ligase [Microbacteriaceae bacterium VKM Ac-2854]
MNLERSRSAAAHLLWLDETGSTNDELRSRAASAPGEWPHLSVVATANQTAGRGRLGRVWVAPPGKTLAASTLVDVRTIDAESLGWVSLIAGVAIARAVRALVPASVSVGVKWPNDVLVDGAKVSGILAERMPDGRVIIGTGVNLLLTAEELPTTTSTSIALLGGDGDFDALLAAYLRELDALLDAFRASGGDAESSGVRAAVLAECLTLGRTVSVERPAVAPVVGLAADLDRDGRLVVEPPAGSGEPAGHARLVVAVGDVTHLRH